MPRNKKTPLKTTSKSGIDSWFKKTRSVKKLTDDCDDEVVIVGQQQLPKKIYKQSLLTDWVSNPNSKASCKTVKTTLSETYPKDHSLARKSQKSVAVCSSQTELKPTLKIGFDIRLHIPGLVDILIPVQASEQESKYIWINDLFKSFENKYWIKTNNGLSAKFVCLICNESFVKLLSLSTHLCKHVGLPLARCTKCARDFFSLYTAKQHVKQCKE